MLLNDTTKITVCDVQKKATNNLPALGGVDDVLRSVREVLDGSMVHPEKFEAFGLAAPRGVLLHGPPGTGKTLLVRAVAAEYQASLHTINGAEVSAIVSVYKYTRRLSYLEYTR